MKAKDPRRFGKGYKGEGKSKELQKILFQASHDFKAL